MIKHLVFWRVGKNDKKANLEKMKNLLIGMKGMIPQVKDVEVGLNFNTGTAAYDIALSVSVENRFDLDAYQNHPEHVKIKDFINSVVTDRAVVDYEL